MKNEQKCIDQDCSKHIHVDRESPHLGPILSHAMETPQFSRFLPPSQAIFLNLRTLPWNPATPKHTRKMTTVTTEVMLTKGVKQKND